MGAKKKRSLKRRLIILVIQLLIAALILNFMVQIIRKPGELLSLAQVRKAKTLEQTWKAYGSYFKKYSIDFITPEYLAALAQVESAGNPWATPQWRFQFSTDWARLYSPESTSLGLYQFTDATFQQAKKLCVRAHRVVRDGRWDDPSSCWFNWTYLRISPSDSIEMAAAQLYSDVLEVLVESIASISPIQKRQLASVIHLCGKRKGLEFFQSRFSLQRLGSCGDNNPVSYVNKVERLELLYKR